MKKLSRDDVALIVAMVVAVAIALLLSALWPWLIR